MGRTRSRRQAIARKLDPYVTIYVEGETENCISAASVRFFSFPDRKSSATPVRSSV